MPRKTADGKPFNQTKYINDWAKQNMKSVKASFKSDFVDEFKAACKSLGLTQSEVIRRAMQEIIVQAKNGD
ncbi:hypothetical protein [Faecalibaculum rodentium]|uniref:hypothetical protein n=1 Tax=Faecalibaculum rodentium TaxID=1702221 RepID=UPI0027311703|nr:hypothetical protein [Faecalibaculum rodentium]